VQFEYTGIEKHTKLVYYGTEKTSQQKLCIKYSKRYGKEVHEAAHNLGFAPKILGFCKLSDVWHIIVMEDLESLGFTNLVHVIATSDKQQDDYEIIAKNLEEVP
jgi:hypothetical protein